MRFKLYFSFLAAIFLFARIANATTFTVTSNVDAGPGSLREALTNAAANCTTDQVIIAFNLPGSISSEVQSCKITTACYYNKCYYGWN